MGAGYPGLTSGANILRAIRPFQWVGDQLKNPNKSAFAQKLRRDRPNQTTKSDEWRGWVKAIRVKKRV